MCETETEMAASQKFLPCVYVDKYCNEAYSKGVTKVSRGTEKHNAGEVQAKTGQRLQSIVWRSFDGQLSLLVDIEELPEKCTLKVVKSESVDASTASSDPDIFQGVCLTASEQLAHFFFWSGTGTWGRKPCVWEFWKNIKIDKIPEAQQAGKMAETRHNFKAYPHDRVVRQLKL